jgi:hypothetical protein
VLTQVSVESALAQLALSQEVDMNAVDRRSALAVGFTAATLIPLLQSQPAKAAPQYGPNDGKELRPGMRVVDIAEVPSEIAAYKQIKVIDVVFQPRAGDPMEMPMDMDMVCLITAGEFDITKRGKTFHVKEGDVYTCGKGKTDKATNTTDGMGVHRIALLVPA